MLSQQLSSLSAQLATLHSEKLVLEKVLVHREEHIEGLQRQLRRLGSKRAAEGACEEEQQQGQPSKQWSVA